MDNLLQHKTENAMEIMHSANIKPIFIPSHSSHPFQPEDLLTFAALKKELRKVNAIHQSESQAELIKKLLRATEIATTPSNNRSSFKKAGYKSILVQNRYVTSFDEAEWEKRVSELIPTIQPTN
ncbi:MAG: hypothetical protein EZS28_012395 [Streblomastix strix]|uniref:DDE-1 domain-containing protein n=1 Tax=Streblomastix strix TaxID=222440 RepID=A0A5J4WAY5_9EUKA|nr:MAG: hypothetical protein EZS28_012395 [Streblomastix strix]